MVDALIGRNTDTGEDVFLAYEDRPRGVAVIGKPGTGKSSLLEHLILTDLRNRTPSVVIDPHGLLAERVIGLAPAHAAERIILLDPGAYPFGLNLLSCHVARMQGTQEAVDWAADSVVETIKKLYAESDEYAPRLERYLRLAVKTLVPNNGTLIEALRLFRSRKFRAACLSRVSDHEVLEQWEEYDQLRIRDQLAETEAVRNRLEILNSGVTKTIVGSRSTTVPFEKVLAGDGMLIVSLPSQMLGQARCNFIGALMLCTLADRIFARQTSVRGEPPRVHIYLDEYQRFATTTTLELNEQGRKYGSGVTFAHQSPYQIIDARIRNASRQTATLVALAIARPDAELLAGEFPVKPKPEWIETVVEQDGWKVKDVFSQTPVADVFRDGHSDEEVVLAARDLFAPPGSSLRHSRQSSDYVKHVLRDSNVDREDIVRCVRSRYASDEQFFRRAMAGELHLPEVWGEALAEETSVLFAMRPPFYNRSPSRILERRHSCGKDDPPPRVSGMLRPARGTDRRVKDWPCQCDAYSLTPEDDEHNKRVWKDYEACKKEFLQHIRKWVLAYCADTNRLRRGESLGPYKHADDSLVYMGQFHGFRDIFTWVSRSPFTYILGHFAIERYENSVPKPDQGYVEYAPRTLDSLRNRLRGILVLADGLKRQPIFTKSGEQEPMMRTRHIVHSGQTVQDALNEFASKLVHPKPHVAHVRLPAQYHQTRLAAPVAGSGSLEQLEEVRRRSQALYQVGEEPARAETPAINPLGWAPPPSIGRQPRSYKLPSDDDPSTQGEDESDTAK